MKKIKMIADGRIIRPWRGYEPFWLRWDTIHQAYERPSANKINIWERIEKTAEILNATVGINSKNCNCFTCHGSMIDEEGRSVEFKLTRLYCYFRYR